MKFKNNLLLGISTLTLAGFAVVGANAGSGKACSASAASDKAACAAKTTSVQTVSNEAGSCGSHATTANAGSCAAKASHAVQTVSNEGGSCASKATNAVQTVSNDACCAGKGAVQTANAGSCASKATHAVQTVSNVGACGTQASHVEMAGACGAKAMGATAANASCNSANPSECMNAWLPEGMSFIRLDVPGGVDFVFSGKGIEKLSQACATSTSAVAAEHGSRFAMTQGDGYVVLSVRGEDAASCCGEVVETAFAGAGIRS
jgi:hypothetical protein